MSSLRHIVHRAGLLGVQRHLVTSSSRTVAAAYPSYSPPSFVLTSGSTNISHLQAAAANPTMTQSRQRSNRSRRGLYDGKDIRTGNKVSFSNKKTKRKFKPNVFKKRLYSEILDEMIQFHLTTSTLRSVDKAGGLDNYLLTSKHASEGQGWNVKQRLLQKIAHHESIGKEILPKVVLPKNVAAVENDDLEVGGASGLETADGGKIMKE